MPTHVDKGMAASLPGALLVNLALIALFGIQHSVMARRRFKQGWTRIVPPPLERSIYCLAAAMALAILFALWRPIDGSLWTVQAEGARMAIWGLFWAGWSMVLISTFLLNHFELFGLQQAWNYLRGKHTLAPHMRTPLSYKWVRHPIYAGFVLAFWATPDMTWGHLLLALGFTVYVLVGIMHEERDLAALFGEQYRDYMRRVGMLVPGIGIRK